METDLLGQNCNARNVADGYFIRVHPAAPQDSDLATV
jgi:hypothetical protein